MAGLSAVTFTFEFHASRVYMKRLENAIIEACNRAIEHTVGIGEKHAKKMAPVRKVTRMGSRARTRALTTAEVAELPESVLRGVISGTNRSSVTGKELMTTTRRSSASRLDPGVRRGGRSATLRGASGEPGSAREVDVSVDYFTGFGERRMKLPGLEPDAGGSRGLLSGRGLAELRGTGRRLTSKNPDAVYLNRGGTRFTLGGRLRDEITAIMVSSTAPIIEYRLISPTEYAIYVEFPTSRTAAQPYMRPAREMMKQILIRAIERELKRITGSRSWAA